MNIVKSDFRWPMGLGTGGDQNVIATQGAAAVRARNNDGVSVSEGGLSGDQLDAMQREVLEDAPALHVHHFAFVMHKIVDGEIFFQRIVDAVEAALLQAGEIQRGFAQGLAGHCAGIDATAAGVLRAFDDRTRLPKYAA